MTPEPDCKHCNDEGITTPVIVHGIEVDSHPCAWCGQYKKAEPENFFPETDHDRDCAYVTSDGPAPCTCSAGEAEPEKEQIPEVQVGWIDQGLGHGHHALLSGQEKIVIESPEHLLKIRDVCSEYLERIPYPEIANTNTEPVGRPRKCKPDEGIMIEDAANILLDRKCWKCQEPLSLRQLYFYGVTVCESCDNTADLIKALGDS